MADPNSYFKKGAEIEISTDDDGFRGAWYAGKVISRSRTKNKNTVFVEYRTLMSDEDETKPLREKLDIVQLRPPAPREASRTFSFGEEVDAYHSDGWWEGVITGVNGDKYTVYFRGTREELEFGASELRLHREWVNGEWTPPMDMGMAINMDMVEEELVEEPDEEAVTVEEEEEEEEEDHRLYIELRKGNEQGQVILLTTYLSALLILTYDCAICPSTYARSTDGYITSVATFQITEGNLIMSAITPNEPCKNVVQNLCKGALAEVTSDEDGFQGAWFAATILEECGNGEYLIEYHSLTNDDGTEPLKEKVSSVNLRPYPPETAAVSHFRLLEEVDALYNDGWWVGVISKVMLGQRYVVYFRGTNEEMEFKQSDLRPHQDWIDGKWVMASQALKL